MLKADALLTLEAATRRTNVVAFDIVEVERIANGCSFNQPVYMQPREDYMQKS